MPSSAVTACRGWSSSGASDLEAAQRAFDAIGRILARAGVGWGDVVDITSFHTDLEHQMRAMVAVIRAPFPAWTPCRSPA